MGIYVRTSAIYFVEGEYYDFICEAIQKDTHQEVVDYFHNTNFNNEYLYVTKYSASW